MQKRCHHLLTFKKKVEILILPPITGEQSLTENGSIRAQKWGFPVSGCIWRSEADMVTLTLHLGVGIVTYKNATHIRREDEEFSSLYSLYYSISLSCGNEALSRSKKSWSLHYASHLYFFFFLSAPHQSNAVWHFSSLNNHRFLITF